jgi:hypothetical protein
MTAALMTVLATTNASHVVGSVRHFQQARKSIVPESLLDSKLLCGGTDDTVKDVSACETQFRKEGAVWTGDINDDGVDELVIYPGPMWSRTGGDTYFLLQRRGNTWVSLFGDWFTHDPEFDILPITRGGYHDLRIATGWCVKWNGKQYQNYDASDYRNLSPMFFDSSGWLNSEILWDIRYKGLKSFQFVAHWVSFPSPKNRSSANAVLNDPQYGLKWIALFKGGVWGVRDKRAFLLLPQPVYTGAQKLEFQGDWLVIYVEAPFAPSEVARYNRRTNEVKVVTNIH